MDKNVLMPDYNHSILNLITSILKNYMVQSKYTGLDKVDKFLENNYTNVVLVILDGMGDNIIKNLSYDGLFYTNKLDTITSVYPSTTTSAITTYYSGKPPIETGWIAWSQYFKEYGRCIDLLPKVDSYTKEKLDIWYPKISDILKYENIFEQIKRASPDIGTYQIMPDYCNKNAKVNITANSIEQLCQEIISSCKDSKKKFVIAYSDEPDSIIHECGCYSEYTKEFINKAEKEFENVINELKNSNTLLIISSDHGHQDISKTISILDLKQIQECLIMPPSLESRMVAFFVKHDMKQEFEFNFNRVFKDKFILYSKEQLLKSNLFGFGKKHYKIDDFLGDYVAIAVSDMSIGLGTYLSKKDITLKSLHCGLTKNEMEVPLILFDLK